MQATRRRSSIAVWAALLALLLASASAVASLPDCPVGQTGPENRVRANFEPAPFSQLVAASQPVEPHQACVAHIYDIAAESLVAPKKGLQFGSGQLEKHFKKHAGEWGAITEKAYLKRAQSLLSKNPGGEILGHTRKGGDVLRYNVRTGEFAASTAEGRIKTLYRPKDGIEYWYKQIGN